jgi:hypothetical protein
VHWINRAEFADFHSGPASKRQDDAMDYGR